MAVQIQLRRDTAANWTTNNPTLAQGEFAIETDTDKYKIGDGSTAWTSLGYSSLPSNVLPLSGGAMTGAITTNSTFDGVDIAVRDAILSSTTTTAGAALPKAGGAMTGAITTNSTFDGVDIATRDAILTSTTTTAAAALPKAGGAMTGAITTNSTFDGVDIATRDAILTSTTTTAAAALPKAGGTMTGAVVGLVAPLTINPQAGTTYTFVLADPGKLVTSSNTSAQTFTVPPTLSPDFPVGTQIMVQNINTANCTLAQGSGVTITSKDSNKEIDGRYAAATLIKTATNAWTLIGALA